MWNTFCTNKICFTQEKTNEQNLHLKRLFCTRPQIDLTEPFTPNFLKIRAPQKEKRRQTQDKIDRENNILAKKKLEIFFKNGKYSKYEVEPKQIYPAFRRYSRLKFHDIIKIININIENHKLEDKLVNLKSIYDNREMRKEAEKQERYLYNLLNRPKSIPFTPALNFISIEQLHNRLKNQLILQQQYLNEQENSNNGNISKRRNSATQIRNNTNNNSKINKSNGDNGKNGNRTNRSQRSQSSKNKKTLKINSDIQIDNNNNNKDENNRKTKKETGTTNSNTVVKK